MAHGSVKLNTGAEIPLVGLGTWLSKPNEVKNAVSHALKNGYRHLDLAKLYQNQEEVAEGIKESGVPREEIFITSKLWNTWHRPDLVKEGLEDTLKELGTDYLDLYLIHFPVSFVPPKDLTKSTSSSEVLWPLSAEDDSKVDIDTKNSIVDTWREIIKLKESGKVKAIGVSNFTIEHIEALIKATGVTPSVNQVERHPLLPQIDLINYCNSKGIHVTAYSPLGNTAYAHLSSQDKIVDYPEIKEIAKNHSADPAQVLISWGTVGGISVIPKSVNPSRIDSNLKLVKLSDEEVEIINKFGRDKPVRFNVPAAFYKPKWDINIFDEEAEKSATYKARVF